MSNRVFVINSGSSSVKYQVIDAVTGESTVDGTIERIGEPGSDVPNHDAALRIALESLGGDTDFAGVGHRVVHGGARFRDATLITPEVEAAIDELSALAPLHNPANLAGIRAARAALPDVPQVAVFDTAFHQTPARRRRTPTRCRRSSASGATDSTAPRSRTCRGRLPASSASWVDRMRAW